MVPLRVDFEGSALNAEREQKGTGNVLEASDDGDHAKDDEGEETVAQHRGCPVGVDATLGHEVEEGVNGSGADEGDAVDVGELGLAGLRMERRLARFDSVGVEHSRGEGSWRRRSRRRAVPRGRRRP